MAHPDDIIVKERGDDPPVLYDGCTAWASYWIEREGSTLELFTGKNPHFASGPSDTSPDTLPHRFPIQDVIDLLVSAGYEVRKP